MGLKMKRYKVLSAYTIAKNCSDMNDVIFGINEVNQRIDQLQKSDKKVPPTFFIRLFKLYDLKIKFLAEVQNENI